MENRFLSISSEYVSNQLKVSYSSITPSFREGSQVLCFPSFRLRFSLPEVLFPSKYPLSK
jgi:hypothetical protein